MTVAETSAFETLRDTVERHASAEGRHASALPGLWFYRSHRPTPPRPTKSLTVTLAVVVQGGKRVRFDDRTLDYGPGAYLLVTGEARYQGFVLNASDARPYLSMGLELPPDTVASTLLDLASAEASPSRTTPSEGIVAELDPGLVDAIGRVVRCLDDEVECRVLAPLAIREIVFRLLRSEVAAELSQSVAGGQDRTRIAQAMAYLRANARRRVSVAEVARHVAMSPSHFAHCFRSVARMSPMRYLKHVRLHDARETMLREGMRASEVAAHVGYASPSHFARDFKTYFGVPPAEYARRVVIADRDIAGSSKSSVA